jgi:hypothetical protein
MSILVTIGIRILEGLFAVGLLGSAVVLILTGIEDVELLFGFGHPEDH